MFKFSLSIPALLISAVALAQTPAKQMPVPTPADSTDGVLIQYDITRKVDGQNIRVVVVTEGSNGSEGAGISATGVDLTEPQMPMPKMPDNGGPGMERIIVKPVKETFSMDFSQRTMTRAMTSEHDPEHKTYVNTVPLTTPTDWKADKKTKKVAGYDCKRATCTVDEEEFTVWYTTDLPGTFSPLSKVFPPSAGVVLALESDEQAFAATTVQTAVKVAKPASVPADAIALTPDEMKAKRREFVQKAFPQGGAIQMRRN
jgi:hypothetical protein